MHTSYETVVEYLDRNEQPGQMTTARFVLTSNDTAWNPSSTKNDIQGPGEVTYRRWPDGGMGADVKRQ